MTTPPPSSWEDVALLWEPWAQFDGGPFVLEGVCCGASGISISNHGGNNLDT